MDLKSVSLFFDNLSFFSRLFNNITLNLNDLVYSTDLENLEGILLENLAKIYSSTNFTFHSNFLVPFHSDFWKGIFLLKSQRNWNLYIFNQEMINNDQFDNEIFNNLLTNCSFKSIDVAKNPYQQILVNFAKLCKDNSKNQELSNEISSEFSFTYDLAEFINDNKYHFTRYREFLIKLCFNPSLVALISPNIFENIVTSHTDETIFADFVNLLFHKSLLLNVPSLMPSYILKHSRFGKYLTIESLGLLYYYLTDKETEKTNENRKGSDHILIKINDIHDWKIKTFTELNLQNNLNFCSLAFKSNIHKYLMKYWQNFKLKAPMEFYNNKYFILKDSLKLQNIEQQEFHAYDDSILLNFYKKTQTTFKSFELDNLDDYYGELIIKVIRKLPVIRKIDLSGLNLGDFFCQLYSDFLIMRKINNITSNLFINLSNNKRITNVGLKYLYVSFEMSYFKQNISLKKKPKHFLTMHESTPLVHSVGTSENPLISGPKIEFDLDIKTSSSTTYILDNGLGSFLLMKIKEMFGVKKMYCFNCDKEVCNRCHKDWTTHEGVENVNCKKPKGKEILMESTIILECLRKNQEKKEKDSKKLKGKVKIFLYYGLIFPYLFNTIFKYTAFGVRISLVYLKKAEVAFQKWFAKLGLKKKLKKSNKITQNKTWKEKLQNFVMGYEEDPKQKEVKKFKFSFNVNTLNEIFGKKRIIFFYYMNLVIFYAICIGTPLFDIYYSNAFFGVYALITFSIEVIFIVKIIQIINEKPQDPSKKAKNLIHNFSLKYYLPLLIGSQLERYDFFTDIQFVIRLFHLGYEDLAYASLIILIIITAFSLLELLFFTYDAFIAPRDKVVGIANENINKFSMLSLQMHFNGIGFCLDLFSTKNAVKIFGIYVPQIMVSSISKCVLENLPQFIIQMAFLSIDNENKQSENSEKVDPVVIYTIISTIMSFLGAIKTALLAKGSILTKKHLAEKFSMNSFELGKRDRTIDSEFKTEEIPLENPGIVVEKKYFNSGNNEANFFHEIAGKPGETERNLIKNININVKIL